MQRTLRHGCEFLALCGGLRFAVSLGCAERLRLVTFIVDVVAVEHRAGFVACDAHRMAPGYPAPHNIASCHASEIVPEDRRYPDCR